VTLQGSTCMRCVADTVRVPEPCGFSKYLPTMGTNTGAL
jgi:hypothetical protein